MRKREPASYSQGTDNLLRVLQPYQGADAAAFPRQLTEERARLADQPSLLEWFTRLVDDVMGGQPERWRVEEDLAIFALVKWERPRRLKSASIQVFRSAVPLDDFYLAARDAIEGGQERAELIGRCVYLRMDYQPSLLGHPFSHPLPHVHTRPDGGARLPVLWDDTTNPVIDFLDLVYRSLYWREWRNWAYRVWIDHGANVDREGAVREFEAMELAFADRAENPNSGELIEMAPVIQRMKACWRDARSKLLPLDADVTLARVLDLP